MLLHNSEKKFAGFWIRLLAWIIDISPVILVGLIFGAIATINIINNGSGYEENTVAKLVVNIFVVLYGVYLTFAEATPWQATWGERLCNVYVINKKTGLKIGIGRAFCRSSLSTIWLGFILVAFTKEKTALHDLITATRAVRGRPN